MRARAWAAPALAALALAALAVGFSAASFTASSHNPQPVSAVADFVAPSADSVIAKSQGGVGGYIRAKGTYYVYADIAESGNPASGTSSVKANVSALTSGQTAVALSAGSYTVGGASYDYRSAQLTASSGLSAGSKSYSLALADAAGNSRSQSFTAVVDNGPFAGSGFETANASGGTSGRAERGDTVSFSFNEAPDPASIVSGWDGGGTKAVTVSIADKSGNDSLSVSGATLGTVALQGDYTTSGRTTTFAGSTLSVSGAMVTIVLGDSAGNARTETGKSKPAWTPSASHYDAAGNACATTTVTAANARQF